MIESESCLTDGGGKLSVTSAKRTANAACMRTDKKTNTFILAGLSKIRFPLLRLGYDSERFHAHAFRYAHYLHELSGLDAFVRLDQHGLVL